MKLFVESSFCTDRAMCRPCRDPSSVGDRWRAEMAQRRQMPGDGYFPCPYGITAETVVTKISAPTPVKSIAIPRSEWPFLVRAIARLAQPGDVGIGDVVKRLADTVKGDTLAGWYKRITGRDCGCGNSHLRLNTLYPFLPEKHTPAPQFSGKSGLP